MGISSKRFQTIFGLAHCGVDVKILIAKMNEIKYQNGLRALNVWYVFIRLAIVTFLVCRGCGRYVAILSICKHLRYTSNVLEPDCVRTCHS
jgi:hypothetical protein